MTKSTTTTVEDVLDGITRRARRASRARIAAFIAEAPELAAEVASGTRDYRDTLATMARLKKMTTPKPPFYDSTFGERGWTDGARWDLLPSASALFTWVKSWNGSTDNIIRMAQAGKLSPEAQRFLAHRLKGFREHVSRLIEWLEKR